MQTDLDPQRVGGKFSFLTGTLPRQLHLVARYHRFDSTLEHGHRRITDVFTSPPIAVPPHP